jgi:hypothetical protein
MKIQFQKVENKLKDISNNIWNFVKKFPYTTALLISILLLIYPSIIKSAYVGFLYRQADKISTNYNINWLPIKVPWSASDVINFYLLFLTFLGALIIGVAVYRQSRFYSSEDIRRNCYSSIYPKAFSLSLKTLSDRIQVTMNLTFSLRNSNVPTKVEIDKFIFDDIIRNFVCSFDGDETAFVRLKESKDVVAFFNSEMFYDVSFDEKMKDTKNIFFRISYENGFYVKTIQYMTLPVESVIKDEKNQFWHFSLDDNYIIPYEEYNYLK